MPQERDPQPGDPLIVAIDGGGTRTRAWLASIGIPNTNTNTDAEPFRVLGKGQTRGSNAGSVGVGPSSSAITEALRGAFIDAGLRERRVQACVAAIAGTSDEPVRAALERSLSDARIAERLTVTDDVSPVLLAGLDELGRRSIEPVYPVVVLASGTGSIARGFGADGERCRAGGLGPAAGDPGSGYAIGRAVLDAGLESLDASATKHNDNTQAEPASVARFARVAIDRYADHRACQSLVDRAADDLAALVAQATGQLTHDTRGPITLVTTGGVLTGSRVVCDLVLSRLDRAGCRVAHHVAVPDPVRGALHMAARAAADLG
ncbi:MAG: N-acetylglucosamine kinase [Phycisphaeraceae bacterium]